MLPICLQRMALHDRAAAVLLLRLRVEHLRLRAETIRLRNQTINLLSSLKDRLDSLVQHNLRLIEFLLNL